MRLGNAKDDDYAPITSMWRTCLIVVIEVLICIHLNPRRPSPCSKMIFSLHPTAVSPHSP